MPARELLGWGAVLVVGAVVGGLTLVDALLLLAVLVLVPAGLPLHGAPRRAVVAVRAAGGLAAVGVLLPRGAVGAVLCVPWLLVAAALAGAAALRWWRDGRRAAAGLVGPVAGGFLVVGAAWLLADRLGLEPVGTADPFVLLTAVHFHHAGAVATTVVGAALGRDPGRAPAVATALVVGAPPVVAAGFLLHGALQVVGAVLLTAGLWTWAAWVLRRGAAAAGDGGPWLRVAALAVVVPMAMAVWWAVGWNTGLPAPSIPTMASTHGVLNALGLGLCGIVGWRRASGPGPVAPRLAPTATKDVPWSSPA